MIISRTYRETARLSKAGHYAVTKFLDFQNILYIGGSQELSDGYRLTRDSIIEYDQNKALTTIHVDDPTLAKYGVRATRSALRWIDRAFKNFFRECKEKAKKLGYPRIKRLDRIKSFDCPRIGFGISESGSC